MQNIDTTIMKSIPDIVNYLNAVITGEIQASGYKSQEELHIYIQKLLAITVSLKDTVDTLTETTLNKGTLKDDNGSLYINDLEVIANSPEIKDYIDELRSHIGQLYPHLLENQTKENVESLRTVIDAHMEKYSQDLGKYDTTKVKEYINNLFTGFGILTKYLVGDDTVEEVQIIDFDDIRIVGNKGKVIKIAEKFASPTELNSFVELLTTKATLEQDDVQQINKSNPFVRLRIGQMRVSIMGGGVAKRPQNHPCGMGQKFCYNIAIRRQKESPMTQDNLVKWGSITPYGIRIIRTFIRYGLPVIAFGGTGTGKTSMMGVFMDDVFPEDLNILTIAETDEMNFRKIDMSVYLKDENGNYITDANGDRIKNPNFGSGLNRVLMWELANSNIKILNKPPFVGAVNASLTMTPDVIILQETKGGEIKDLMEEAFTGHQVLTTMHVNETRFVALRILLMYQQSGANIPADLILSQVPASFPVAIEFTRYRDGSRKVSEISELVDIDLVTKKLKVRPFVKFRVTENTTYLDEVTGKLKIRTTGVFDVIHNPIQGRLKRLMLNKGLLNDEIKEIDKLYQALRIRDENLIKEYELEYDIPIN